jgi:hypothetical protein
MPDREYPRWLYYRSGEALLVADAAAEALCPPGHKDTFGKFLPPDHVGYVPDPDGAPCGDAPPMPIQDDLAPSAADALPVEPLVPSPPKRGRGRPRKTPEA